MAQEQDADLLQAALTTAFTEPTSLQSSVSSLPSAAATSVPVPTTLPTAPPAPAPVPAAESSDDAWKEEYEARLANWRAESARGREKAEQTRAHFEALRAQEEKAAKVQGLSASEHSKKDSSWENVERPRAPVAGSLGTPGNEKVSPADARDLVTGESPRAVGPSNQSPPLSHSDFEDGSQSRWEDIPSSLGSSYPSLPSNPSPPQKPAASKPSEGGQKHSNVAQQTFSSQHAQPSTGGTSTAAVTATQVQSPAVTPLVFTSTLPVKTRALALLSSLAINLFLPFVNGVMLGFGEIFARNVIGPWLGWKSIVNPNGTPTLERTRLSAEQRSAVQREEKRK